MQMTWYSVFALLILAVQGSYSDLANSFQGTNQMTLPTFASLMQKHLGDVTDSTGSSHASGWRAQAQIFFGLLESTASEGGSSAVVPVRKAQAVRNYTDQIILLLEEPLNEIYAEAVLLKNTTQQKLNTYQKDWVAADEKADQLRGTITTINTELTNCYSNMIEIETNHTRDCSDPSPPSSCIVANNTKMFEFSIASKYKWSCNFGTGSTAATCVDPNGPLNTDMLAEANKMEMEWDMWKIANRTCAEARANQTSGCHDVNVTLITKKAQCQDTFINVSDHLCAWREWIQKRTNNLDDLKDEQVLAPTLLPPKKKAWTDLNLIICMLKVFRDRTNMTWLQTDYDHCDNSVKNQTFVDDIDILLPNMTAALANSNYNDTTLNFSYTGGLAYKFLGDISKSVQIFSTPVRDALGTLYAKTAISSDSKKLDASCAGYKVLTPDAEKDCSKDTSCKMYDLDGAGAAHSVSSACTLVSGSAEVAKKICYAGLRVA